MVAKNSRKKELKPLPDKTVVLSFDDGCRSDVTLVGPLLKRMEFGGTFYVSDAFHARYGGKAENYVTWSEAKQLDAMGFEIGNHTMSHPDCRGKSAAELTEEVEYVERKCRQHGIARPTTFCYPGYHFGREILQVLKEKGYRFARRE
jgi:peptidoglycan/xylan/chitin deacetylase (PgdA/CDA1 family)